MKVAIVGITVMAALFNIGSVAAADGKAVFEKSCKGCHTGMPPKGGAASEADVSAAVDYMIEAAK